MPGIEIGENISMGKYIMKNTCNYDDYEVYACFEDDKRLFADVVKKDSSIHPIDAYMILINPGSCTAVDTTDMKEMGCFPLSRAAADPAMRCVMRFMGKCSFNRIRILNLIDNRNARLSGILKDVKEGTIKLDDSLFSDKRLEDFNLLTKNTAPFILAWGVGSGLDDYKLQAMKRIQGRIEPQDIIAVPGKNGGLSFKYIKPWSVKAQDEIIDELAEQFFLRKCRP